MFNLILSNLCSISYGGLYNSIYLSLGATNLIIDYLIAIFSSIIVALIIRLPILPKKPYRYSFEVSALYPIPIIAIGILSLFFVLNYYFVYNGKLLALIIGIFSALFCKYLFFYVFPKPPAEELKEETQ